MGVGGTGGMMGVGGGMNPMMMNNNDAENTSENTPFISPVKKKKYHTKKKV